MPSPFAHRFDNTDNTQTLASAIPGQTVRLVEIQGGRKLRKRMADLGLNIGMTVRVTQGNLGGPVVLAVKNDGRLAIGRGMARKIYVEPSIDND